MEPLPAGFRVVGALSAVYATVTGGCFAAALVAAQVSPDPNPRKVPPGTIPDWLVVFAFAWTSLVTLLAGCLLFIPSGWARRVARLSLLAAALGLALEAALMIPVTLDAAKSSSTGGLAIFVTGPVFVTAAILALVVLITGVKLGRYLPQ
jgi:hypothetical protein